MTEFHSLLTIYIANSIPYSNEGAESCQKLESTGFAYTAPTFSIEILDSILYGWGARSEAVAWRWLKPLSPCRSLLHTFVLISSDSVRLWWPLTHVHLFTWNLYLLSAKGGKGPCQGEGLLFHEE